MLELERKTKSSCLNFVEMSLVVQLTSTDDKLEKIVANVLDLRTRRNASPSKRRFDNEERKKASKLHGYVAHTFDDYADLNFRYLKATGLVQSKGRGLSISPERHVFVEKLIEDKSLPAKPTDYFHALCKGATLPTDNKDAAQVILDDLISQANRRNIPFSIKGRKLATPADISLARYEVEDLLRDQNEIEFANRQAEEWQEIVDYMDLLISRKKSASSVDAGIVIPQSEAPAYFEWVLWRAFLAIDSLVNPPYKSRRFKIDQDFLPVGTAPGGGPDLQFEFKDFAVVVEVTLTDSSRQEAAEGESVRRHVADFVLASEQTNKKPVYGLFLANHIDSNTAETFRVGGWYTNEDKNIQLNIVPVTLQQFKTFFVALFSSKHVDVSQLRKLLDDCNALRPKLEAASWKQEIDRTIRERVAEL